MEIITKYKANDGSEWLTEAEASNRERLICRVNDALQFLRPKPDTTDFANGHGYVQQSEQCIRDCKKALFEIANQDGVLKWWIDSQKKDHGKTDEDLMYAAHSSWFGRMLDGSCRPLEQAYGRLDCIDSLHREWGQPFYANNPDKAIQIEV